MRFSFLGLYQDGASAGGCGFELWLEYMGWFVCCCLLILSLSGSQVLPKMLPRKSVSGVGCRAESERGQNGGSPGCRDVFLSYGLERRWSAVVVFFVREID